MKKIPFSKIKTGMIVNLTDEGFKMIKDLPEVKAFENKLMLPIRQFGEVGRVMKDTQMLEVYLCVWSSHGLHFKYLIHDEWISHIVDRDKNKDYLVKENNWEWLTDFFKTWKEMFVEAKAFVTDPDARKLSKHKYPNGNGMSVREAKAQGLSE